VIDGATNTVVTTIPLKDSFYRSLAVNAAMNRVYTVERATDFSTGTTTFFLTVIDGATNTVSATVPLLGGRDLAVNPTTNHIYVLDDISVTVVDGATNAVVDTILIPYAGFGMAVNPTTNHVYVVNRGGGDVTVIEGATNTVLWTIPLPWNVSYAMAANPMTSRVYLANSHGGTVFVLQDRIG
jgi:YVTN family beta-propeller protein